MTVPSPADTLHKEGGLQRIIAERAGCSWSAVSMHFHGKSTGKAKCFRTRCASNRGVHSLEMIVKQCQFKNLGKLHKEETEAGVRTSSHHSQACPRPSFHTSKYELNVEFHFEIKFPESWGRAESPLVCPLCFIKSNVNTFVYWEILEHFCGDLYLFFQQELAPVHSAKTTQKWFPDHGISVLDWSAYLPDMEYCLEEAVPNSTIQMSWRLLSNDPRLL